MADIQESSSSDGLKRRVVDSQSTTAPTPTPENTVESQSKKLRAPTTSGGTLRILFYLAAFGFLLFVLLLAVWLYEPLKKAYRNTRTADHESEKSFQREDGTLGTFPSVHDPATLALSVVVPAYNEEERMRIGLNEMVSFLTEKQAQDEKFTWEIIIVNDGSKDKTKEIAMKEYVNVHGAEKIRLLDCYKNGGKGAAVRKGMLKTRGKLILMADADGATAFKDFEDLKNALKTGAKKGGEKKALLGFALGSRAHAAGSEGKAKRSALRRFLMWGFHSAISLLLGGNSIADTQCGFKLFTRAAAAELFSHLHIERWAFDVELVYIASRVGVPMVEVPVTWHEVAGSKLDPSTASIQMLRDIIVIRLAYLAGFWKL